ncbi:DUF1289 domain-containing protein [Aliiglaciecola sp.]|nr:DUF1289 domain-containing protein [Aliiglaciecola sp.]
MTEQFDVTSPCIRQCCLDKQDMCVGCFRKFDEILVWGSASDEKKTDILKNVKNRKIQLTNTPNITPQ